MVQKLSLKMKNSPVVELQKKDNFRYNVKFVDGKWDTYNLLTDTFGSMEV